jgi:hypothetical protein
MTKTLEFIKPSNKKAGTVDWLISEKTQALVKYYSEYCEISQQEVVDEFLQRNLVKDDDFINWVKSKRNNKRILKAIGIEE